MNVDVAHLTMPKPGERKNGDAVLVRKDEEGRTLLAVVDGLGHGPLAAEASQAALDLLQFLPLQTPVLDAMRGLHDRLRETRGAVATLCIIDKQRLETCAVGNVQLMSANCTIPLVLSAGVLGRQVAKYRICEATLRAGARIALLSDGIALKFRLEELKHLAPNAACSFILDRFRRGDDDATVLVADLSG
jgi:phosphoserine phosphatase RsbX